MGWAPIIAVIIFLVGLGFVLKEIAVHNKP
jgi:hypothetical protein